MVIATRRAAAVWVDQAASNYAWRFNAFLWRFHARQKEKKLIMDIGPDAY